MLDRVTELLYQHGISQSPPSPITNGASGAFIFDVDGKYIVKYARKTGNDPKIFNMFVKEYDFYRLYSDICSDFIPDVIFQTANQEEIFIVLRKYAVINHDQWNDDLIKRAMQLCARINSIDATFQETNDYGSDYDVYPLTVSLENWLSVQNRFPDHIDASLLNAMYENFDAINSYAKQLPIPKTLCHGDFHPQNFLMDGDKLIICDWQTVGIGRGISDVAFFISRGSDMGISMNKNMMIEEYHKSMKYVELSDLYKNVAASDFYVSFKFWAEYLLESDISRVLSIYNSMAESYKTITCE